MARAILIVCDSFGLGGAPDAARYGDEGANTLGHIADTRASSPQGPLRLPFLTSLGLGQAARLATGRVPAGLEAPASKGLYGSACETSLGKDTPSGHWEIAGVPVLFDWGYFPDTVPSFPIELTEAIIREGKLPGLLGNKHASGTVILDDLGQEHVRTGKPIIYTSADSVCQIAAHEEHFGLERLYDLCKLTRRLIEPYNIGRVIARPFIGENGHYTRTGNRHDYAVPPPEPTLLDALKAEGRTVIGIGKIADIFANRGITASFPAHGNEALFETALHHWQTVPDGGLLFANLIDFDSLYGHRRDALGYAQALEALDQALPRLASLLKPGDVVILTADHGCDPTWHGTDHTREQVPVLAFGPGLTPRSIGVRESFADIAASLAQHLGLAPQPHGTSFL